MKVPTVDSYRAIVSSHDRDGYLISEVDAPSLRHRDLIAGMARDMTEILRTEFAWRARRDVSGAEWAAVSRRALRRQVALLRAVRLALAVIG